MTNRKNQVCPACQRVGTIFEYDKRIKCDKCGFDAVNHEYSIKPKFRIGDIVFYKNDFSYNPACDVISVGKVEGIHIHRGKGLFADSNDVGKILYSVSGSGLTLEESELSDISNKIKS